MAAARRQRRALPLRQDQLQHRAAARWRRACTRRIPATGFLPSTGPATPAPARIGITASTAASRQGDEVSGYYDALLAKLIVHAPDRPAAAARLARACAGVEIWPMHSNAALLAQLASHPQFIAGKVDTGFIERHSATLLAPPEPDRHGSRRGARLLPASPDDPWSALTGWRGSAPDYPRSCRRDQRQDISRRARRIRASARRLSIDGDLLLFAAGMPWRCREPSVARDAVGREHADGALRSPMPGRIVSVTVQCGEAVRRGQRLVVLEAMKMEHAMTAPFDGVVAELPVREGEQVSRERCWCACSGRQHERTLLRGLDGRRSHCARAAAHRHRDRQPAGHDADAQQPAAASRRHCRGRERVRQILVNGIFTFGLMVGVSVADTTLGVLVANLGYDKVRMPKPVFVGDTLRAETTVSELRESQSRPGAGIVTFAHRMLNQRDESSARRCAPRSY
jgi:acyl dehydratase/biotin carboxyl carrier protein